jgi:hypothetical protein
MNSKNLGRPLKKSIKAKMVNKSIDHTSTNKMLDFNFSLKNGVVKPDPLKEVIVPGASLKQDNHYNFIDNNSLHLLLEGRDREFPNEFNTFFSILTNEKLIVN